MLTITLQYLNSRYSSQNQCPLNVRNFPSELLPTFFLSLFFLWYKQPTFTLITCKVEAMASREWVKMETIQKLLHMVEHQMSQRLVHYQKRFTALEIFPFSFLEGTPNIDGETTCMMMAFN